MEMIPNITSHLPVELFIEIFDHVDGINDPQGRSSCLRACRSVSHLFNDLALPKIYQSVALSGPNSFFRFLEELRQFPCRALYVKTLDFSAFTSVGLGRTRNCNTRIQMLTASTLNECLLLCRNVEQVLLSEALDSDMDRYVLKTLFGGALQHLKTVDFCAATGREFDEAWKLFLQDCLEHEDDAQQRVCINIENLSFHKCSSLPPEVFEQFLPMLPNLRKLDMYQTRVTGTALASIPYSARLVELSLGSCARLSAMDLVRTNLHPASKHLKSLLLSYGWNKTHPLSNFPEILALFLATLPCLITKLDISGVELDRTHLACLPKGIVELGVHDIDTVGDLEGQTIDEPISSTLQYLSLSINVLSQEVAFANLLSKMFPGLSILESPSMSRLSNYTSKFAKYEGAGRRDWFHNTSSPLMSHNGSYQWHQRKLNMTETVPRGLYAYYAFRV